MHICIKEESYILLAAKALGLIFMIFCNHSSAEAREYSDGSLMYSGTIGYISKKAFLAQCIDFP